MKTMGLKSALALALLGVFVGSGCSGSGDKKAAEPNNLQTVAEAPPEIKLDDKLKAYANHTGTDLAEIKKVYNEKFGDKLASTLDANLFNFFIQTDTSLAGFKDYLPEIWQGTIFRLMFSSAHRLAIAPGGDGDSESIVDRERERSEGSQNMLHGFNSTLLLIRSRLIEDAGFFDVKVSPAKPNDFKLPEKFFGGLPEDIDPQIKDGLTALLYSASVNVDGNHFSFFQFFDSNSASGERRVRRLGKLAFISAEQNILFPEGIAGEPEEMLIER